MTISKCQVLYMKCLLCAWYCLVCRNAFPSQTPYDRHHFLSSCHPLASFRHWGLNPGAWLARQMLSLSCTLVPVLHRNMEICKDYRQLLPGSKWLAWVLNPCSPGSRSGLSVLFETKSCYTAQTGLKLIILLPQPPEHWNSRCVLPH